MKTIIKSGILALVVMFFAASCKKEAGPGGKKVIKGTVTNNGAAAPGAIVTIAYDAKEAVTRINDQVTADANGVYTIPNLQTGDYYVDASYTNAYGIVSNTAGTLVTIGKKKGDITVDLDLAP